MSKNPVALILTATFSLLLISGVQSDVQAKTTKKSSSTKSTQASKKTSKKTKKTRKRRRVRKKAHKKFKLVPPPPPVAPSILPELAYSRKSPEPITETVEEKPDNPYAKYIYYQDSSQTPSRVVKSKYVTVYSR